MRLVSIFCLSALLVSSCNKDKYEDPFSYESLKENNTGTVSAKINNSKWNSNLVFAKVNPNSPTGKLLIEGKIYQDGLEKQSVILNFVDPNLKEQKIYSNRIATWGDNFIQRPLDSLTGAFSLTAGDIGENLYDVVNQADGNLLYIDYYNSSTSELRGRYQMTLVRTNPKTTVQTQGLPDTLRITEGSFNVKIAR